MKTRTAPIPVGPVLGVDLLIVLVSAIAAFLFTSLPLLPSFSISRLLLASFSLLRFSAKAFLR